MPELHILQESTFYLIRENKCDIILEDKTKVGLTVCSKVSKESGIGEEIGTIHDKDGVGHPITIRWFFTKKKFELSYVLERAQVLEKKYLELREMTCPGDI